jgi:hypothetical protein
VRFPLPELLDTVVVADKFTGFVKEIAPPVVRRVPPRDTVPPPLCVNDEEIEVLDPPTRVSSPVFTIATGPEAAVIILPMIEKELPVREIPFTRLVLRDPKRLVPAPVS